ncbi:TIGR02444 family protein [Bosea sp. TND4EK4]|uniref:TIGR02444 family protein n=1 Tax=Bosea sp. TND4EK4 TaxID=1907408 RepID=UPI000956A5F0|nr:TIGR02444 family protein [Bosea sp. TND4EK4]SIR43251.1 TIGR02444 family protein [Bosea sp. TND4EK4]
MSAQESCWRFIGAVYAAPDVQDACLRLQQRDGADIVLLLFGGWLASEGVVFSSEGAADAAALVWSWREQAILPLRAIRTQLKSSPAVTRPEGATLRDRIRIDELAAERIELDMLVEWRQARFPSGLAADQTLVAGNLAACLPCAPIDAASKAWLDTIVAACADQIAATPRSS